jgi:outer membrane protein assembly factor BamB
MKRIISLIAVVLIAVMVFGQEKQQPNLPKQASESAKIKVEKIWERKFDKDIEDISATNNGETILVCLNNGDKVYLDKLGKILKRQKGKRGRALENGMFISYDGELLDSKGNTINKLVLGPPDIEYPIFSPSGKYFAIVPSYDADFPFLKVYETASGKLLWQYQKGKSGEIYNKPFVVVADFISDTKLAVYTEGIITVYNTISGTKIWEKDISKENPDVLLHEEIEHIQLDTSESGDVLICYRSYEKPMIYLINASGIIKWYKKDTGYARISRNGEFIIEKNKGILRLFDSEGNVIWHENIGEIENIEFVGTDDQYIVVSGLWHDKENIVIKEKKVFTITANFYLLDRNKNFICKIPSKIPIGEGGPKFWISTDRTKILIKSEKYTLSFFNIVEKIK